jgi:hypothetical protein
MWAGFESKKIKKDFLKCHAKIFPIGEKMILGTRGTSGDGLRKR